MSDRYHKPEEAESNSIGSSHSFVSSQGSGETGHSRRVFLKGAAGLAAVGLGLGATTGTASAQQIPTEDLGNVPINICSSSFSLPVTAEGGDLTITIEGPDTDQFAIISGENIPDGQTGVFEFLFVPSSTGQKQARIVGRIDGEIVAELGLVGTGITLADATPEFPVPFGDQQVGTEVSVLATASFPPSFPEPVEITGIQQAGADPDEFEVTDLPIGTVVQPGETFQYTINFSPTSLGDKSATLAITAESVDNNYPFCVLLGPSGTAVEEPTDRVGQGFDLLNQANAQVEEALDIVTTVGSVPELRPLLAQAQSLYQQSRDVFQTVLDDPDPDLTDAQLDIIADVVEDLDQIVSLFEQIIELLGENLIQPAAAAPTDLSASSSGTDMSESDASLSSLSSDPVDDSETVQNGPINGLLDRLEGNLGQLAVASPADLFASSSGTETSKSDASFVSPSSVPVGNGEILQNDSIDELIDLLEEVSEIGEAAAADIQQIIDDGDDNECPPDLNIAFKYKYGTWWPDTYDDIGEEVDPDVFDIEGDKEEVKICAPFPFAVDYATAKKGSKSKRDSDSNEEDENDHHKHHYKHGRACKSQESVVAEQVDSQWCVTLTSHPDHDGKQGKICWFRVFCPDEGGNDDPSSLPN